MMNLDDGPDRIDGNDGSIWWSRWYGIEDDGSDENHEIDDDSPDRIGNDRSSKVNDNRPDRRNR